MKTHLEIEAKYDVADGHPLPDLVGAGGVDAMVAQAELVLTATYFDTADLSLAAAGATLRRRTGGTDDGWHLKLPLADGERLEVHRGLGRGQSPPTALVALVRGLVRSNRPEAVATLVTRRTVHHLLDPAGLVLAELADDSVTAERHDVHDGQSLVWRELEIELVDGDRAILAELDVAVRAGGAIPAAGASKVGRVLDASLAAAPPRLEGSRRKAPVGAVLGAGLRQAVLDLSAADPLVRLDRAGAPARMRAAVQRLRAALALQRQVLPDEVTASVRAELAWLDTVVAGVEELDTAAVRIRSGLAELPGELVLGPVGRRADRELAAVRRTALAAVREALDSPRYLDVLERVADLPTRAPTDAAAAGRSGDVLPDLAERAVRRAERRLEQLRRAQSAEERRWQVRGAQRAVERARYAELLASDGADTTVLDEAAAALRDLDAGTQTQVVLRDLAVQAQLAGENGFTFGLLHGLEHRHATEQQRRLRSLRKQLKRLRKV